MSLLGHTSHSIKKYVTCPSPHWLIYPDTLPLPLSCWAVWLLGCLVTVLAFLCSSRTKPVSVFVSINETFCNSLSSPLVYHLLSVPQSSARIIFSCLPHLHSWRTWTTPCLMGWQKAQSSTISKQDRNKGGTCLSPEPRTCTECLPYLCNPSVRMASAPSLSPSSFLSCLLYFWLSPLC